MSFEWKTVTHYGDGTPAVVPWQTVEAVGVTVYLEQRPHYCDRGNFIAKLDVHRLRELSTHIDGADGWPRYYFDEERAKREIEAWITKRGLEL